MSIKHNGTDEMVDKGYAWVFFPAAGNGLICAKVPSGFAYGDLFPLLTSKAGFWPKEHKLMVLSMNHDPSLIDNVDALISAAERKLRETK